MSSVFRAAIFLSIPRSCQPRTLCQHAACGMPCSASHSVTPRVGRGMRDLPMWPLWDLEAPAEFLEGRGAHSKLFGNRVQREMEVVSQHFLCNLSASGHERHVVWRLMRHSRRSRLRPCVPFDCRVPDANHLRSRPAIAAQSHGLRRARCQILSQHRAQRRTVHNSREHLPRSHLVPNLRQTHSPRAAAAAAAVATTTTTTMAIPSPKNAPPPRAAHHPPLDPLSCGPRTAR